MSVITRYKLDGGTNSAAARKILPPEGLIRRAVNFRLRRDSELEQRPGFTALAATVYDQGSVSPTNTLVACDVMGYDGRLFALGTLDNQTSKVTLFEYLGLVKGWRRVATQIPSATRLREVGSPPDQEGGIASATCAAYNGTVCLAYQADTAGQLGYYHVFRASDDATIAFDDFTGSAPKGAVVVLVTLGHIFHAVGLSVLATFLSVQSFTIATSEEFTGSNTLQAIDTTVFAAAAVATSVGGYVTIGCHVGDLIIRHYNDSHVQQMTRTISTVVANYLAIAADGTADRIVFGYLDDADDLLKYRTIKLSDGTDVAGPTTLSATTTNGAISVAIDSASNVKVAGNITTTTPRKAVFTVGGGITWQDAQLTTEVLNFANGANPDNLSFAGFVQGSVSNDFTRVNSMGVYLVDEGVSLPVWFKDFGTGGEWPGRLGSCCQDSVTGLYYSTSLRLNNDLENGAAVTEWAYDALERRQTAVVGGLLHIAGALPLSFDGRQAYETSWGESLRIYSLASSNTASGAITTSAAYFIQVFPEMVDAHGDVHRGPPSAVYPITTGAADDTITGLIGRGHSFRNVDFTPGSSYRLVICRTAALADKTAGELLYRETSVAAPNSTTWGNTVSFTLVSSDSALRALGATQGTIYTQGQTPIPHQSSPPASYLCATTERLAVGGLPRTTQWQQSKLLFPGEGVHFSDLDLVQFQGRAEEAILGIADLGGNLLVFCRRSIHLWQGEGPDHSGQGEFSYAACLSREGGLIENGWRSIVETDAGVFFQREDEQICFISQGGGVDWTVGQQIRDELALYPVVVAAVYLRKQHSVAFALQSSAGDAGEVVFFDLRRKVWFVHDLGVVKALCEYQGRLAYVNSSGAVFLQDAAPGTGAMPTQVLDTYDFDFGTGQSWGEAINGGMVGDYRGDTTVALSITYDSGLNYTAIGSWAVTAANGYSAGKTVSIKKAIPDRKCALFGLRWQLSGSSGSAGLRINEITLETDTAPGMQRLPARDTQ